MLPSGKTSEDQSALTTTTYPRDLVGYGRNTARPANGRTTRGSPSSSCSITRRAARTTSSTATRRRKPSCPRSSARSPGRASATSTWNRSTNTAPAPASGGCGGCSPSRNIPVTVYGVTLAMARNPEAVAAMKEADWEIASHGYRWLEYKDYSEELERRHIREAIRIHTEVTGERPLGMYQGKPSANTLQLVDGGGRLPLFLRHLCRRPALLGEGADGKPFLIIPYTLDANDMRFATPQGFNSGDQFFTYLKDAFDTLYAEGERAAPKMMSRRPALPPRRPARAARPRSPASSTTSCRTTRSGCRAASTSPGTGTSTTSRKAGRRPTRHEFIDRFGGVFEHSPFVAERAFDNGLVLLQLAGAADRPRAGRGARGHRADHLPRRRGASAPPASRCAANAARAAASSWSRATRTGSPAWSARRPRRSS